MELFAGTLPKLSVDSEDFYFYVLVVNIYIYIYMNLLYFLNAFLKGKTGFEDAVPLCRVKQDPQTTKSLWEEATSHLCASVSGYLHMKLNVLEGKIYIIIYLAFELY